jgi:hypothetical protein
MRAILAIIAIAFAGVALAVDTVSPAEQKASQEKWQREFEEEQFARRKFGTLDSTDIARWTPEMKTRFKKETPGFKDWDGLANDSINPNLPKAEQDRLSGEAHGRLDVSGPQLADYTSKKDAAGMFWYIGIVWLFCPLILFSLLSHEGTRAIGVVLLIPYLIFIFPRIIEAVALFVVLPAMIVVGIFKGIFKS